MNLTWPNTEWFFTFHFRIFYVCYYSTCSNSTFGCPTSVSASVTVYTNIFYLCVSVIPYLHLQLIIPRSVLLLPAFFNLRLSHLWRFYFQLFYVRLFELQNHLNFIHAKKEGGYVMLICNDDFHKVWESPYLVILKPHPHPPPSRVPRYLVKPDWLKKSSTS